MKIEFEFTVNPGDNAGLVTGVQFMKNDNLYGERKWWGFHLNFWLLRWELWREWLFSKEIGWDQTWYTFKVMICGFEVLLEKYDRNRGDY